MPTCPQCKTTKNESEFYRNKTKISGLAVYCKECMKASGHERYEKNKNNPSFKQTRIDYRKGKGKQRCNNSAFKYKYGIDLQEKQNILDSQGGVCACCGSSDPQHKQGWALDHNHKTKKVRAVLCQPCNTTIGCAKESILRLQACISYLLKRLDTVQEL